MSAQSPNGAQEIVKGVAGLFGGNATIQAVVIALLILSPVITSALLIWKQGEALEAVAEKLTEVSVKLDRIK